MPKSIILTNQPKTPEQADLCKPKHTKPLTKISQGQTKKNLSAPKKTKKTRLTLKEKKAKHHPNQNDRNRMIPPSLSLPSKKEEKRGRERHAAYCTKVSHSLRVHTIFATTLPWGFNAPMFLMPIADAGSHRALAGSTGLIPNQVDGYQAGAR